MFEIPVELGDFIDANENKFAEYARLNYKIFGIGAISIENNSPLDDRFWVEDENFPMGHPNRGGYISKQFFPEVVCEKRSLENLMQLVSSCNPKTQLLFLYHNAHNGESQFFKWDLKPENF